MEKASSNWPTYVFLLTWITSFSGFAKPPESRIFPNRRLEDYRIRIEEIKARWKKAAPENIILPMPKQATDDCTVIVSRGSVLRFACYNLGALATSKPYTPRWELNGGYWQWGRLNQAAIGPFLGANGGPPTSWNTTYPPNGAWLDARKTGNDPCPTGFRVPTAAQWEAVFDTNIIENVGTWTDSPTYYGSGKRIRKTTYDTGGLFLPAAGGRYQGNGSLVYRGSKGFYWSSTEVQSIYQARNLEFAVGGKIMNSTLRTIGMSVRCVAE